MRKFVRSRMQPLRAAVDRRLTVGTSLPGIPDDIGLPAEPQIALLLFTLDHCAICQAVGPLVAEVAAVSGLRKQEIAESEHPEVWHAAGVPGAPYLVAVDAKRGVVLARGAVNERQHVQNIADVAIGRFGGTRLPHAGGGPR